MADDMSSSSFSDKTLMQKTAEEKDMQAKRNLLEQKRGMCNHSAAEVLVRAVDPTDPNTAIRFVCRKCGNDVGAVKAFNALFHFVRFVLHFRKIPKNYDDIPIPEDVEDDSDFLNDDEDD
jgi:hypothetical protein